MKIIILFIGIFRFLCLQSFGQEIASPAMGNLFWKISNPTNKNVSYLFGTIHLIDKEKYILPKNITKRMENSDLVVMEIENLEDPSNSLEKITLKTGRMTDVLNEVQKDSLYRYTELNFGMDSANFEMTFGKFKPIFFLQLPFSKFLLSSESYDLNINKLAKKAAIPILGLETMEEQIGYFDSISSKMKADMIMQVVHDTTDMRKFWNEMQNMYLNQQVSDMTNFSATTANVDAFYQITLLSERNKKWIKTLSNILIEKNLFIAVGAGHLPGNNGLISLLAKEGYLLTPVQIKLK